MGRKIKTIIVIFVICMSLILTQSASAQSSSTWRTRVGNPISSGGLLAVGDAIKKAYDICSSGDTHDPPSSLSCLQANLEANALSSEQVAAFTASYPSRKVGSPIGRSAPCVQCLGFVGLVTSAYAGDSGTLRYPNPKAMTALTSFAAGAKTFVRVPDGEPPLPGDIGIHGGGSDGHIVIVKEVIGNVRFKALESNGNSDCRITDTRELLIDQYGYKFFREQS